jgi:membrane-associated phospholipid phosphatase
MRTAFLVLSSWFLVTTGAFAQPDTGRRTQTLDEWLAQGVRRPEWVRTGAGHDAASFVSFVGGIGPYVSTAGLWIRANMAGSSVDQQAARTVTQSLLIGTLTTGALKMAFGRSRPYLSADTNSIDYRFGRGWRNDAYQSMPSGHTTAAFAFATAMSHERARIRGRSHGFDALMYGGASLVGLSRIALDKHWLSDVLAGAAIGTGAGLLTVRLAR